MRRADPTPADPADKRLYALLDRYGCPLPFHAARAQLLGAFASPAALGCSRETFAALWGDQAPIFASETRDAELDAVMESIADRVTRPFDDGGPCHLVPLETPPTRDALARLALVRREEIDAFVAGLFGKHDALDLTPPAHAALDSMADIRSLLQYLRNFLDDPVKRTTPQGLAASLQSVEELMGPLEAAMNKIVEQCRTVRERGITQPKVASVDRVLH